jgi:transcriptional regulator with XRE-family HTH domain
MQQKAQYAATMSAEPTPTSAEASFVRTMLERRQGMGWSQTRLATELADQTGLDLDPTTITRIEQGRRRLRLDESAAIARVLDFDLSSALVPHPGGLDEMIERATDAWLDARDARELWQVEEVTLRRRLDDLIALREERRRDGGDHGLDQAEA